MTNLKTGSGACPLVSECKDIAQGIAQENYSKAALNAGLIALSASASFSNCTSKASSLSSWGNLGQFGGMASAN